MFRLLPIIALLLLASTAQSQAFRVYGKVMDNQLQPLAFASVEVRELRKGKLTAEDGSFEFYLAPGKYEIIISMVGYEPMLVPILMDKDHEQNFILREDEKKSLNTEVVVRAKIRDGEEIIRNVIQNKSQVVDASGDYSASIYIRATQKDSVILKDNRRKDTIHAVNPDDDLSKMAMAEILIQLDKAGNQIKEERVGVTKRGSVNNLYYLSTTEGDFNLYNNHIKVPGISQIPFVSPISYSGLIAYKFKTTRTERKGKHRIYTVNIKPRTLSNATIEGEVVISDSGWVILESKFTLPIFHLPEYDHFEVEQKYDFVNDRAWMITRQKFSYFSKYGKGKKSGQTIATYRNFELNKDFPRGHFGNAVSITKQEAYEKDSSFWIQSRTEPLSDQEIRFINYKDSIFKITSSKAYLDSLDKVINKITWKNVVFLGQAFSNHEKESKWVFPPLTSIVQIISFGGTRLNLSAQHTRNFPSKKRIEATGNISYGFRNNDINGSLMFSRRYNPLNGGSYTFKIGRDFQYINEGDAWINMIKRSNIYLNNFFGIGHTLGLMDGVYLTNDFEMALRRSVADYATNPKYDSILGDVIVNDQAIAFQPYNAVYSKIRLDITPGLKYIREPKEKIALGSKFPSFYIEWRKGLHGIFKSEVNFDYLEFGMQQKIQFGTAGNSTYKIKTGTFTNTKDLRMVDYNFQRRGDPLLFSNPHKAFQALDSTFPLFKRFYEGHYVHEFNGMFLNKIPLLKKLELREVAGGGFLYAPERDLKYFEAFAGVERIFKWPFNPLTKFKLGVYVTGSVANKFNNPVQFKVGITKWDWLRNRWL